MPERDWTASKQAIREFTPAPKPYLVFMVVFLPPAALCFHIFLSKSDFTALVMGCVCILFMLSVWLWIFQNQVSFSSEAVIHGRFRPFRRYLAFEEMKEFYTFVGFRDDRGRTGPFVRLVIEPNPESNNHAIVIPFKLFSATDCAAITELLSSRLPTRRARSARVKG